MNSTDKISAKTLFPVLCFLAALCGFAVLVVKVVWGKDGYFDVAEFSLVNHLTNPLLTKIMILMSFLGSSKFLLPAYVILVSWLLWKKQKRMALYYALIGIISTVLVHFLKIVFHKIRPSNPLSGALATFGFPSGHAASSFIFYGLIICLVWRANLETKYKYLLSIILGLITLMISFSRIYLHMHFASDVFGGICIGIFFLSITVMLIKNIKFNTL